MGKAKEQLEQLALDALSHSSVYEKNSFEKKLHKKDHTRHDPFQRLEDIKKSLNGFLDEKKVHPDWDMPLLTEVLIDWGTTDPIAFENFIRPISHSEEVSLKTYPGLLNLYNMLLWISDDHDYVLDEKDSKFELNHESKVSPYQSLIGPTKLALKVLNHRGLALPVTSNPVCVSPKLK